MRTATYITKPARQLADVVMRATRAGYTRAQLRAFIRGAAEEAVLSGIVGHGQHYARADMEFRRKSR